MPSVTTVRSTPSCMSSALPAEIWIHIFNYAVEDDSIFLHSLPTSMAEATWFKMVYGDWSLRTPNESQSFMQLKSYAIKKVPFVLLFLRRV